jgi:hypothetical protein
MSNVRYRDVMSFDLSEDSGADISNATLSLYRYHPSGSSRPQDTIVEFTDLLLQRTPVLQAGIKETKALLGIMPEETGMTKMASYRAALHMQQ